MIETTPNLDLARQAATAAQKAAADAGITIEQLHRMDRLEAASGLFQRVWSAAPEEPIVTAAMLRALTHAENYVAGAYVDGKMLGAIMGFLGTHDGELELHSHVLGVLEEARGRSVGFALKQHQRAWALARGIGTVSWTFDPLVRRNAYFNLTKLGARVGEYHENFYGEMSDAINGDDESDRMVVRWRLASSEAVAASERVAVEPDGAVLGLEDARVLLPDGDEGPEIRSVAGPVLLAWLPEDIVEMRTRRLDLARKWRLALRETVGAALGDGYTATAVTRGGWLVLEARPSSAIAPSPRPA